MLAAGPANATRARMALGDISNKGAAGAGKGGKVAGSLARDAPPGGATTALALCCPHSARRCLPAHRAPACRAA